AARGPLARRQDRLALQRQWRRRGRLLRHVLPRWRGAHHRRSRPLQRRLRAPNAPRPARWLAFGRHLALGYSRRGRGGAGSSLESFPVPAYRLSMSIYDFTLKTIEGAERSLADFRGKVVLIVNTASECGSTPQYAGLEQLHEKYAERGFLVLGFP